MNKFLPLLLSLNKCYLFLSVPKWWHLAVSTVFQKKFLYQFNPLTFSIIEKIVILLTLFDWRQTVWGRSRQRCCWSASGSSGPSGDPWRHSSAQASREERPRISGLPHSNTWEWLKNKISENKFLSSVPTIRYSQTFFWQPPLNDDHLPSTASLNLTKPNLNSIQYN